MIHAHALFILALDLTCCGDIGLCVTRNEMSMFVLADRVSRFGQRSTTTDMDGTHNHEKRRQLPFMVTNLPRTVCVRQNENETGTRGDK